MYYICFSSYIYFWEISMTIFHSILLFSYPLPISLSCVISWFSYLPVFPSILIYLSIYQLLSIYLYISVIPSPIIYLHISPDLCIHIIYTYIFIYSFIYLFTLDRNVCAYASFSYDVKFGSNWTWQLNKWYLAVQHSSTNPASYQQTSLPGHSWRGRSSCRDADKA